MNTKTRLLLLATAMHQIADNAMREMKMQLFQSPNPIFIPTKKMQIRRARKLAKR